MESQQWAGVNVQGQWQTAVGGHDGQLSVDVKDSRRQVAPGGDACSQQQEMSHSGDGGERDHVCSWDQVHGWDPEPLPPHVAHTGGGLGLGQPDGGMV